MVMCATALGKKVEGHMPVNPQYLARRDEIATRSGKVGWSILRKGRDNVKLIGSVATHLACRHLSGFFLSYMAEFWDNEWRVRIVSTCHSLFASRKAKERTPWPASLVRSFLRSYNQDDYTERTAICREIYGDFQGCLPRRIPTCGLPTLQLAG